MNIFSLALRNLDRQRRRTLLLGSAIAFGVMTIGLLNTLASSLANNVQRNILESAGGTVFFSGQEMTSSGRIMNILRSPESVVQALASAGLAPSSSEPRSSAKVAFLFGSKGDSASLDGLGPGAFLKISRRVQVVSGTLTTFDPGTVVVPRALADKLGIQAGEVLLVRTQTVTGQENVQDFRVAAIIDDPTAFGSLVAYADLESVNRLLGIPKGQCQSLAVTIPEKQGRPYSASQVYQAVHNSLPVVAPDTGIGGVLGGLAGTLRVDVVSAGAANQTWDRPRITVRTLQDLMAPILGIVETLKGVNMGILLLLLLIIMVGISNTFRMVLLERTREIGTLRALGMHRSEVLGVFLAEALFLSLGGIVVGTLAAAIVAKALGLLVWTEMATSTSGIFFRSGQLGMDYSWGQGVGILVAVSVTSVVAAWGPARMAALMEPALALRTQN